MKKKCPECGGDLKLSDYTKKTAEKKSIPRSRKCEYCDYKEAVPYKKEVNNEFKKFANRILVPKNSLKKYKGE